MIFIQQRTHLKIKEELSGTPIELKEGYSRIQIKTSEDMIADEFGLVHGGFTFSLADYAAMLAVNHPNVLLTKANVKFLKPVVSGDIMIAEGKIIKNQGKKYIVKVNVRREKELIFEGDFLCFVSENHILKSEEK